MNHAQKPHASTEDTGKLILSIEIAKAGFENAQGRINLIDTKVSIAVGMLIVLLPVPLALINWLTGLQADTSKVIFNACLKNQIFSGSIVLGALAGMFCAYFAILRGISCLSPRGPRGYGKSIPFQKDWEPNVLFPIHKPEKMDVFHTHLKKLHSGVGRSFVVNEYDHQLQQLGRILHAKFMMMTKCFWWLNLCLACYGIAVLNGFFIGLKILVSSAAK